MPKQKTFYYCDICEKGYLDRQKAVDCEKSHFLFKEVKSVKFDDDDRKPEYPESILVELENGKGNKKTIRYYRERG